MICLVLFSAFCAYKINNIAVSVHNSQADTKQTVSLFSTFVDSFHLVNTLYHGTVNCFSTIALSSEALNETFTYKQALQQPDYHDYIKAMVTEVDNHETRKHWTLMLRHDMPADTKYLVI